MIAPTLLHATELLHEHDTIPIDLLGGTSLKAFLEDGVYEIDRNQATTNVSPCSITQRIVPRTNDQDPAHADTDDIFCNETLGDF